MNRWVCAPEAQVSGTVASYLKFLTSDSGALSLAEHEKSPSMDELIGILIIWGKIIPPNIFMRKLCLGYNFNSQKLKLSTTYLDKGNKLLSHFC